MTPAAGIVNFLTFSGARCWSDDLIKGLLASVSRRFPIGVILTLETGAKPVCGAV